MEESSRVLESGYPTVDAALRAVADDADAEGLEVHRISIRLLASAQVTYKMHTRGDDELLGGVIDL